MKKHLAFLLATGLVLSSLSGCTAPSTPPSGGSSPAAPTSSTTAETTTASTIAQAVENAEAMTDDQLYIGVSVPSFGDEYMVTFADNFRKYADPRGIKYEIIDADGQVIKQIEQIENLISMGINTLFLYPIELQSSKEVLQKARDAGIYVICGDGQMALDIAGDSIDCAFGVNQYDYGDVAAKLASEWVDKTYPDAAEGSIECLLFTDPSSDKFILRQQALQNIETLNPKIKVVEEYSLAGETNKTTKTMEYAEMALITHPQVKLVICHSTAFALAVDEVFMRTNSGITQPETAIFCVDWLLAGAESIKKAEEGQSCVRGLSMLESVNSAYAPFHLATREFQPDDTGLYSLGVQRVTSENVDRIIEENK